MSSRIYILDRNGHSPLYHWVHDCGLPVSIVKDFPEHYEIPSDAAIFITAQHYEGDVVRILDQIHEQNTVPLLILSDGVLEYRNTWLRPDSAAGTMFQPVFGHKIACIGKSQARLIESWGNQGKCEVIGIPRLDDLIDHQPNPSPSSDSKFKLLIVTARTPAFTDEQMKITRESLADLKNWFEANDHTINSKQIEVQWRLTGGLEIDLQISDEQIGDDEPLVDALKSVDAVITTPSTAVLEAMLLKKPVALLNYHNCPDYVPAAWRISAPQHIESVVTELIEIPEAKKIYQQTILHDALECESKATDRLVAIVQEMVDIGRQCRDSGKILEFPYRILKESRVPENEMNLAQLYPQRSNLKIDDISKLKVMISHLERHVHKLNKAGENHSLCWWCKVERETKRIKKQAEKKWKSFRSDRKAG